MFNGPSAQVSLKVEEDIIGDVIDWLGRDFLITGKSDGILTISVKCNENAMFFGVAVWTICGGDGTDIIKG